MSDDLEDDRDDDEAPYAVTPTAPSGEDVTRVWHYFPDGSVAWSYVSGLGDLYAIITLNPTTTFLQWINPLSLRWVGMIRSGYRVH